MAHRISMKIIICIIVVAVTGVFISSVKANAKDVPYVSLESILLFSLHESLKIKIANEQRSQANFSLDEAESEYLPDIALTAEGGVEYNDPAGFETPPSDGETAYTGLTSDINLSLRQMLFDKTKTMEIARREQAVSSKDLEVELVIEDTIEETVNTYIDVLSAQKEAYLSAEMLIKLTEIAEKIDFSYSEGGISKSRADFASARLALAESKYSQSVSSYKDATSRLKSLTGPMPDFLVIEPQELSVEDYDMNFYKHLAKKKNSELRLIESNIQSSQLDYKTQEARYLPKVDFVAEAGRGFNKGGDTGGANDASAIFRLQYDIFKGGERKAAIGRTKSKVKELEYEKEDLIRDITKNVKIDYNEIQGVIDTIETKTREVESYLSLRDIAFKASEVGEVDLFKSIENEENLHEAMVTIFQLESDKYKKSYSLLRTIGALKKSKFCESC